MNQCSRCNKPCAPTTLLCDECRIQLRGQFRHLPYPPDGATEQVIDKLSAAAQRIAEEEHDESILHKRPRASRLAPIRDISADIRRESTPYVEATAEQPRPGDDEGAERASIPSRPSLIYRPLPALTKTADPIPSLDLTVGAGEMRSAVGDLVPAPADRTIDDNPPVSGQFPGIVNTPEILPVGAQLSIEAAGDIVSAQQMPDLWPWLLEADIEESDTDNWANRTDPLTLRHFPSSNEAARIEEEDIRRAMAEGTTAERSGTHFQSSASVPKRRRTRNRRSVAKRISNRLRIIFIILAILAVLAFIVDGVLLSAALLHPHRNGNGSNGPATLALSSNAARIGDKVTARISHFAPSTSVLLTHDIEEPVQTTTGSSSPIKLDSKGNANVSILIDTSWGPGFHTLAAEDVTTRYTASAQLQILGAGETKPSHLLIDPATTLLNMGADFQGANTIKMLTLRNSGDGTPISWAASSNKPWLMISPAQGIFSESQAIAVAVDRANLKPGNYTDGILSISSNVGGLAPITIQMSVKPLPPNAGPVLAVTPAVLSFTAADGGANPAAQSLTLSNPGTLPLNWSLTGANSAAVSTQSSLFRALGVKANWLSTNLTSGTILPGVSRQVQVTVNSRSLLPGAYTGTLVFSPNAGAYDKAQTVSISLTVQPHCGLSTSTGSLSFTAVAGQSNPSNQALGLSATASCTAPINWTAMSSASWLSVTPASGHLNGEASAVTSVAVNASVLTPGTYNGVIALLTGQSTQSVTVQLTIQPQPSAGEPIIAVSGLTLNFSNTQGQQSPASQVVTITNNGGSPLHWSTSVNQLAILWLGASPSGGAIPAGKTGQLSVNVNTGTLTPGTYVGQIGLTGKDSNGIAASGSGQTITVNLLVLPPCTLAQPSSSSLVFNATQNGANPGPQTVQITATGNCNWPLSWHASVSAGAFWLNVTPASGSISVSGQSVSLSVAPNIAGLQATPAPYTAQVTITATDSAGTQTQGSPQAFSVSLSVVQPCQLVVSPTNLAFSTPDAQAQTVTLSETGRCALPVSWTATGDSGSSSWLVLSSTSGSDTGTNSTFTVSVNPADLSPGTYTGTIAISATNAGGSALQGSGQVISVTLTVSGFTVSGSVLACSDTACTNPAPLPGAMLTVLNSLNNQVASTTADSSGNYVLSLAPGTYTVKVTGTDSNGNSYSGSTTLTVTGNQVNVAIRVF